MKKTGIIGGSGFIGSHITKVFLNKGYDVKVSTTDISKKEKYEHLMNLKNSDHLYLSELKMEDKSLLKEFVKNCDIIIHSGTPFQLDFKDAQTELFDPTIKGTENFLEIIKETPGLKKVVFIASVAVFNTNFPLPVNGKSADETFSEKDKPFISKESHPYAQAKFMAHQTIEQFITNNPDLEVEITSVSPVMVAGNSLSKREDSTSTNLQFLIKKKQAPNPFIQSLYDLDVDFAIVDVRDVAKAVFNAATTSGLNGKNYLLSSETYPVSDISLMLNRKMPKNPPKTIYQNQMAKNDLDMSFRAVKTTLNNYLN